MGCFGGRIGEGVVWCLPSLNSFLIFGVLRLCHFWWKSIKKCETESARRRTEARWFYNLSHAHAISMGQIITNWCLRRCSASAEWRWTNVRGRAWWSEARGQPIPAILDDVTYLSIINCTHVGHRCSSSLDIVMRTKDFLHVSCHALKLKKYHCPFHHSDVMNFVCNKWSAMNVCMLTWSLSSSSVTLAAYAP